MFLNRRLRALARDIAGTAWSVSEHPSGSGSPEAQYQRACQYAESSVLGRREEIAGKKNFKSILGTIIISLVMKAVLAILAKYLEDAIFEQEARCERK